MIGIAFVLAVTGGEMELRWAAPPECPSQVEVEARVRELVGPGVQIAGEAQVDVVKAGERFAASVTLRTEGGTTMRSFAADSCVALADAVALVVAVGLDPLAVSTVVRESASAPTIAPPPPTPTPSSTRVESPPRLETAPRFPPRRRPRLGLRGFAQGNATVGILPDVGGLAGGGLALTLDAARIEIAGAHEVGRRFTHPDRNVAGALVSASTGRVAACWTPSAGRFIFPLCAGAEIGVMTARGRGIAERGTVRSLWATAVPHFRALWFPIPRIGFGPVLEMPIALVRPRFTIDGVLGDVVQAGPIGARIGLAIEVLFFDETRRTRR